MSWFPAYTSRARQNVMLRFVGHLIARPAATTAGPEKEILRIGMDDHGTASAHWRVYDTSSSGKHGP
jgi:hypothetical protein